MTQHVLDDNGKLYLDLLKRSLLNLLHDPLDQPTKLLNGRIVSLFEARMEGLDWPEHAHTMIGWKRLNNLQSCVEQVLQQSIGGDLLEAGVWRGGAAILMRGILKAYGVEDRTVWLADSFEGLPKPNPECYPADREHDLSTIPILAVSLETVQNNFESYRLLDRQVRFLKGWFRDTLPKSPIDQLAILRLDGDLYESTIDTLNAMYPKVVPGGFVIVDDYGALPPCRAAVDDYLAQNQLSITPTWIDWTGVYWQKLQ